MHIFSKEYRRAVKQKLVNKLYEIYQNRRDPRYSDDLQVFVMKSLHMHHPINCMLIMWLGPKWAAMMTYWTIIWVLVMFVYMYGCFLSSLEYKINKLDITIADPVIMLFGGDITPANRVGYSITTIVIYLIFATTLLLCRFYPFQQIEL